MLRFRQVGASRVRLVILEARACQAIGEFGPFKDSLREGHVD